jgi:hypothetical protein
MVDVIRCLAACNCVKQADFRARPEIANGGLGYCADISQEERVPEGPCGMRVLADVQGWAERQDADTPHRQQAKRDYRPNSLAPILHDEDILPQCFWSLPYLSLSVRNRIIQGVPSPSRYQKAKGQASFPTPATVSLL